MAADTPDLPSRRMGLGYSNGTSIAYGYAANNDLTGVAQTLSGDAVMFAFSFNQVHQRTSRALTSDAGFLDTPEST